MKLLSRALFSIFLLSLGIGKINPKLYFEEIWGENPSFNKENITALYDTILSYEHDKGDQFLCVDSQKNQKRVAYLKEILIKLFISAELLEEHFFYKTFVAYIKGKNNKNGSSTLYIYAMILDMMNCLRIAINSDEGIQEEGVDQQEAFKDHIIQKMKPFLSALEFRHLSLNYKAFYNDKDFRTFYYEILKPLIEELYREGKGQKNQDHANDLFQDIILFQDFLLDPFEEKIYMKRVFLDSEHNALNLSHAATVAGLSSFTLFEASHMISSPKLEKHVKGYENYLRFMLLLLGVTTLGLVVHSS